MKININHSPSIDAERVIFTSIAIKNNFYQKQNFIILPRLANKRILNTVHFPNLNYQLIPNYWKQTSTLYPQIPLKNNQASSLIKQLLPQVTPLYSPQKLNKAKTKLTTQINLNLTPFIKDLLSIFPHITNLPPAINIYLSPYGTTSSYRKLEKTPSPLHIFIRSDQDFSTLAGSILSSLVKNKIKDKLNLSWKEYTAVKESLLHCTILKKYIKIKSPLMAYAKTKQLQKHKQESDHFARQLGFPSNASFAVNNHQIFHGSKKIVNLGSKERQVLTLLINHQTKIVSYDQIADLWPNEDFSLWAIAKLIQRIRQKLSSQNIPPALIQTKRNAGYSLI